jgi:hypothetical protein
MKELDGEELTDHIGIESSVGDSKGAPEPLTEGGVENKLEPLRGKEPGVINFVTVYETGDPGYIAFVKSLFESEGIKYYVKGERLQDLFAAGRLGVGFNPVVGPVAIQVDEKDVENARDLLSQIEQGNFELSEDDIANIHAGQRVDDVADKYTFKEIILKFIRSLQRD